MEETDRTVVDLDAGSICQNNHASSFICTDNVDKLAWRSKMTTEQSFAILHCEREWPSFRMTVADTPGSGRARRAPADRARACS